MGKTTNLLLAGFGGQGVLFAAKLLSYAGLLEGREVSWLPSYGPEMRGGTANCSVVLSDESIGSPLVLEPGVLLAMNQPSFDKFHDTVVESGIIIIDSLLVPDVVAREGVRIVRLPATKLAEDNDLQGLANVVLTGVIVKASGCLSFESVERAIEKSISARRAHLLEPNIRALRLGYEYEQQAEDRL
jgi:2-oxoglutarate ferredoxin oxidoreductase subunit gamma